MSKKDEILDAEKEEDISEEKIFFEEEPAVIIKSKPFLNGTPCVIINIMGGDFILDCNGNGIRMPISKEHKDKKIGDTIYL